MEKFDIMQDIAERTGGDIYLGVVGPVRTGKSTFIKRFMELLVLPNIDQFHERERAHDEMPQSGAGRTIMTTEPKFIPAEAVEIPIISGMNARVRLVDCVGYGVAGALGFDEGTGAPRMVHTPWFDEAIPFQEAAEIGTRKVITDHSTIGIVVTTDGDFTGIDRENFRPAEDRVIAEMKELGKPFVIIFNCQNPESPRIQGEVKRLSDTNEVTVLPMNVATMTEADLLMVLQEVLYEFPVTEVNVNLPRWIEELETIHWLRQRLEENVAEAVKGVHRIRDIDNMVNALQDTDLDMVVELKEMKLATGAASICITIDDCLYYKVLTDYAGMPIEGQHSLIPIVRDFATAYKEWHKMADAWIMARASGYGVVPPYVDDMYLEDPELIKQGGHFGVRLKASAPSYHIIKTNIGTEITPLIGTERQCEELVRYIMEEFEDDPQKIWDTNIFGKSLSELVQEGIQGKIYQMPENAQGKLQETLQRIVNEGGGGLICIIL